MGAGQRDGNPAASPRAIGEVNRERREKGENAP
jgi:hypothetical protein